MQKLLLLMSVLMLVAGCATDGEYVSAEEISDIRDEVATASELEERLGPPSVTIPIDESSVKWVYEGVHVKAGVTRYIPLVDIVAGVNHKECTRLTVLVDRRTGALSDWRYAQAKATDHWTRTSDKCTNSANQQQSQQTSESD